MRTALLQRDPRVDDEQGTVGTLALVIGEDIVRSCHTMEPPWRQNARNLSCIPPGHYRVLPHLSPRFGRCLLVDGVENRTHILFHAGNLGGDRRRGWKSHTLGCILPGMKRGRLNVAGVPQRAVLASRTAMRQLLAWADDRPFQLQVS